MLNINHSIQIFKALIQEPINYVIPECLCRESSDLSASNVTGSPTQAFGDDKIVFIQSSFIKLLLLSCLFSNPLSAGIINGTHWVIKPGDSLYKIARNVFPGDAKKQAQFRKQLVSKNPQIFKNGANNLSVGDRLQLPDNAIKPKKVAPVVVKKIPRPVVKPTPAPVAPAVVTADPEDIVGQVVINIGNLRAENRGSVRTLKRHSPVYRGDKLSTGNNSHTQIRLKDGALLSLRPFTDLRIAEYRYNGREDGTEKSLLELLKGGFRTISGAIGHVNKRNYRVKTKVATIGIRGTHYTLVLCQQQSCSNENENIEDGLYGGVADGSIVLENQTGTHTFNNDQFFKLTSDTAKPVEFLTPPIILKHGPTKLAGGKNPPDQKPDKMFSKQVKSIPRRLPVIFQANQPDRVRPHRPPVAGINSPPAERQPLEAPDGSAMLLSFNQFDATGTNEGTAAGVVITPNNNNQIFLATLNLPDGTVVGRVPFAGREISTDQNGNPVVHELAMATPSGTPARLVPSSIGGNATLGVNWGRWNGEFTVLENGTRLGTRDNFHFIYSENITTPSQLANLGGIKGSASYASFGGTNPTDNAGNIAASFASIDMDVDFQAAAITNYTVNTLSVGGLAYHGSNTAPVLFTNLGRDFDLLGVGCSTGSCTGAASVQFIGPTADGAITSFHLERPGDNTSVTGVSLLTDQAVAPPQ